MRAVWRTAPLAIALAAVTGCSATSTAEPTPGDTALAQVSDAIELHGDKVTAKDLSPKTYYTAMLCQPGTSVGAMAAEHCNVTDGVVAETNADGVLTAEVKSPGYVAVGGRKEVDCGTGDLACLVAVAGVDDKIVATVAVTDPPAAPTPPVLTLGTPVAVQPSAYTVSVTGSGYRPGEEVKLAQCPASGDKAVEAGDCLYDDGVEIEANSDGEISGTMTVYQVFQLSDGKKVDCAADTRCVVADPWPEPGTRMSLTPLTFTPGT